MNTILDQFDPRKLINPNWLFETAPDIQGLYLYLGLIYGLFLIAAVALGVYSRRHRDSRHKFWSQIIYLLLLVGVIGLVLIFFRWQEITYLGSRILVVFLWLAGLIWLVFILFYRFVTLPKKIKVQEEKNRFEKYLPKKSRKIN